MKRMMACLAFCQMMLCQAYGEEALRHWSIAGDFGRVEGVAVKADGGLRWSNDCISVSTSFDVDALGVESRKTVVRNVSGAAVSVRRLLDRYVLGDGTYEVYTQFNRWQGESQGGWQLLHTGVEVQGSHLRSSYGAAPILAVWNRNTGRGRVWHLVSKGAWEMRVFRFPDCDEKNSVAIEVGVNSRYLSYGLAPGESVELPQVLAYEFKNRLDLDAYKLHAYWNREHPARCALPSVYNTWLCQFDGLNADDLLLQVQKARKIGIEYFVVDAGWFGSKSGWWTSRGDWDEKSDGALGGRLMEVSRAVRASGMKFGLWVEAESANDGAEILKSHPEWFRTMAGSHFLDFEKPEAFSYIVEAMNALVRKYGVSFFKFDFNQSADFDVSGTSFMKYTARYAEFLAEVRRRNPGIYLEGCASGGQMMNLAWADSYDSFWLSDNQSPYDGVRIVKETMKRLPPRLIERWLVLRSADGIHEDLTGKVQKLLACGDAWWRHVQSVSPEFVKAFACGGPIGISCDLKGLNECDLSLLADIIAKQRKDAAFWSDAVGRILCDVESMTVLQYVNVSSGSVRIVVVPHGSCQEFQMVHPVLDELCLYDVNGETRLGAEVMRNGIRVNVADDNAVMVVLNRRKSK